jgi:hypothetical protein
VWNTEGKEIIILESRTLKTSMPWSQYCIVFGRSQVQISARIEANQDRGFVSFRAVGKNTDITSNDATTLSCHILYSSLFTDHTKYHSTLQANGSLSLVCRDTLQEWRRHTTRMASTHYKNGVDTLQEWRRHRRHTTRMASTQATHYKNGVDTGDTLQEWHRHRRHTTRMASTQATHYKNGIDTGDTLSWESHNFNWTKINKPK